MKSMRIAMALLLLFLIVCTSVGCTLIPTRQADWGSFTDQPVTSSDGKYRAEHGAKKLEGYNGSMIQVDVYDAQTNELLSSFVPARAMDFWGVCWEENSHNLWIQSGDIGIRCYALQNGQWVIDEAAPRPESIVSKYDKTS